ncbi:tRNA (adenosine(37)-N6)-threonylcarbamoyltransferase complex dimerization subunit type 1 TsaB [Clostridium sp. Cult1]|uniref:tRNA (adenosine(37)-N6)-threonylcarbamoyltransferase complex dimerization subunit type 1 TsaB n=1 Tax=Clostridium sp. Cult1 TaxID=2079002 RepID=UPI001EFFDC9C|nr:tRNA (adenosine(37)-N6)-threonylcarbamoyltransferase complex dimerization subunit type 1 TsaB [Clostridium sp. Cult1]MCF6464037.1 tRNA (adenosine(37)-N6)-threonylcarbamoyltransferase complex dimerization subunit type 1 TsaB [Clostridium sp. Cult1]
MKVLGLDTSTMMTTCAVLDDENLLGEYSLNQDMTHSENLVPMIKEVLDSLNIQVSDIDLYGVAIGPGSFTGLRIGIATVKSFAHVFNKPIIGISTLEGLAFNLTFDGIIVPMIDARRNRVYTGIYKWEKGRLKNILEPSIMEIEELLELLDKDYNNIMVNGNGALLYKEKIENSLKDKVKISPISLNSCKAASIAELALLNRHEENQYNYYNLVPDYLRESQAQRELRKRES